VTVRSAGFVSRAAAGLVPPRSVSYDFTPGKGGLAVHYGGPLYRISGHDKCAGVWRGYQSWHMRPGGLGVPQGGNDIAYSFGVCPHGYIFAGRGLGVRPGANGSYSSNSTHYAVCWMNDRTTPNVQVLDAVEWVIDSVRSHGAGMQVKPHRNFYSTDCPGDPMAASIVKYDGKPLVNRPKPPEPPTPPGKVPAFPLPRGAWFGRGGTLNGHGFSTWQGKMHARGWTIAVDGVYGPESYKVALAFQAEKGLARDGLVGKKTWDAAWTLKVTR
jgi:peptidoglycan hydrolase-like protein with peptidoglycan-binding domain